MTGRILESGLGRGHPFGMQFEDQPAIGQACVANDADLPSEFAAKCNRGANQQGLQDLAV